MHIPDSLDNSIHKLQLLMTALEHPNLESLACQSSSTLLMEVIDSLQAVKTRYREMIEREMNRAKFPAIDQVIDTLDLLWILHFALEGNGHHAHEHASGPLSTPITKLTEVRKYLDGDL